MRIIFLDIDGVINTTEHEVNIMKQGKVNEHGSFDPIACENVNRLAGYIPEPVGIVITSTWRRTHGEDELAGFLEKNGITVPMVGVTPHVDGDRPGWGNRGDEIGVWLEETKLNVDGFVILDDDMHDLKEWAVAGRLVHIKSKAGFSNVDYLHEAKRILRLNLNEL